MDVVGEGRSLWETEVDADGQHAKRGRCLAVLPGKQGVRRWCPMALTQMRNAQYA